MEDERRSHGVQVIASLLVALVIVAATIAVVTAKLGPGGGRDSEGREELLEQREELREERQELREERVEREEDE